MRFGPSGQEISRGLADLSAIEKRCNVLRRSVLTAHGKAVLHCFRTDSVTLGAFLGALTTGKRGDTLIEPMGYNIL